MNKYKAITFLQVWKKGSGSHCLDEGLWLGMCVSCWMRLVVNLQDIRDPLTFGFKRSRGWKAECSCRVKLFLRELWETWETRRGGQQTDRSRAYERALTTGYGRLNLVVNLGKRGCHPSQFSLQQRPQLIWSRLTPDQREQTLRRSHSLHF